MPRLKVGFLIEPQATTYASYMGAVRRLESLGVDTIWDWDHFFSPNRNDPSLPHFEGWTLLSAVAALTTQVEIGCMVTCNSYRNPALLANMAKTVDHISGGRLILGIGAGWFEWEYREYGYPYGSDRERIRDLENALPIIKHRWEVENPPPVRNPIPILIGAEGEKVMLRIVAEHADLWNAFGPPETYHRKNGILNDWCERVGRDPAVIERTVTTSASTAAAWDDFVSAGASHIVGYLREPWDFDLVERIAAWRDNRNME